MHFLLFLVRSEGRVRPETVLQGLERNFNGQTRGDFMKIVDIFFSSLKDVSENEKNQVHIPSTHTP